MYWTSTMRSSRASEKCAARWAASTSSSGGHDAPFSRATTTCAPRAVLGVEPQIVRARDVERERVVVRGAAPDEDARARRAHEGAVRGSGVALRLPRCAPGAGPARPRALKSRGAAARARGFDAIELGVRRVERRRAPLRGLARSLARLAEPGARDPRALLEAASALEEAVDLLLRAARRIDGQLDRRPARPSSSRWRAAGRCRAARAPLRPRRAARGCASASALSIFARSPCTAIGRRVDPRDRRVSARRSASRVRRFDAPERPRARRRSRAPCVVEAPAPASASRSGRSARGHRPPGAATARPPPPVSAWTDMALARELEGPETGARAAPSKRYPPANLVRGSGGALRMASRSRPRRSPSTDAHTHARRADQVQRLAGHAHVEERDFAARRATRPGRAGRVPDRARAASSSRCDSMGSAPMNGRSFPNGQANIGLLKALYRTLAAEKGTSAADAWLRRHPHGPRRLRRRDPHAPAVGAAPRARRLRRGGVARGDPARMEAPGRPRQPRRLGPRPARHDRARRGVRAARRGRQPVRAHDALGDHGHPARLVARARDRRARSGLEADGLLRLARLAELAAVPALFGYPGATRARSPEPRRGGRASRSAHERMVAGVRGRLVGARRAMSSGGVGGLVGVAAGAVPLVAHVGAFGLYALVAGVAGATGALGGRRQCARTTAPRATATRSRRGCTRSSATCRSASRTRAASARTSRDRSRPGSTASCGAWAPGATGVIYEAVRISDGQPVAIKLLRVAAAHDAVASDRLRREAEALGLSWHPNVVEVIDHGYLPDGTAYLVMELLPRRVARQPPAQPRAPHAARAPADRAADVRRAGRRARGGRGSPGREAVEHAPGGGSRRPRRAGAGEAARLRHRARRVGRDAHHQHRRAARHARLHVAGARDRGGRDRRPERPLLARRAPVRVPGGRAAAAADPERARSHGRGPVRGSTQAPTRRPRSCRRAGARSSTRRWRRSPPTATPTRARSRRRCAPFEKTSSRRLPEDSTRSDLPARTSLWLPMR